MARAKSPRIPAIKPRDQVIACARDPAREAQIEQFARDLRLAAPGIGTHGLDPGAFAASGLFDAAVEKLRGQKSATMKDKKSFVREILDVMQAGKHIKKWSFAGGSDRHDYEIHLNDGRLAIVEAKGCLDGNNSTIYKRPPQADEFLIWSLCQNPGSDPGHNGWSGIHTRLGAHMMALKEVVDGLVIWDMLCGTAKRPCPKLIADPTRATRVGNADLPPPCLYLFPATIPDARSNPSPRTHNLAEVGLLDALYKCFGCGPEDLREVKIEAKVEPSGKVYQIGRAHV